MPRCAIIGHSFGAVIALEFIRELKLEPLAFVAKFWSNSEVGRILIELSNSGLTQIYLLSKFFATYLKFPAFGTVFWVFSEIPTNFT